MEGRRGENRRDHKQLGAQPSPASPSLQVTQLESLEQARAEASSEHARAEKLTTEVR